jgi:putative hydrolase of the HAD superfamily
LIKIKKTAMQRKSKKSSPKSSKPSIDAVIFDIGMVLLFFDFKVALEKMNGLCSISQDKVIPTLFSGGLVELYDRGKITTQEFSRTACQLLGFSGSPESFIQIWSDIFELNDPMAKRAMGWKKKGLPIYLLSNTCESHIEFFKGKYDIFSIFDGEIFSCREKCAKPDRIIYETILHRYQLKPERTLFIDDRLENVEAAHQLGIQAIQYVDEMNLLERMKDYSLD